MSFGTKVTTKLSTNRELSAQPSRSESVIENSYCYRSAMWRAQIAEEVQQEVLVPYSCSARGMIASY